MILGDVGKDWFILLNSFSNCGWFCLKFVREESLNL